MKTRIITGLVGVAIVLAILYSPVIVAQLFVILAAGVAAREFILLTDHNPQEQWVFFIWLTAILLLPLFIDGIQLLLMFGAVASGTLLVYWVSRRLIPLWFLEGILYIGIPLATLIALRSVENGREWIMIMQLKIWLQEQQSAFVEALAALVNQNTFSANTEGVEIGMQMVDMWAAAAGFTTQTINEKHRLVCTEKGTANNRILLVAHMDTVHPADGDFQTYEPLADGFVRGPGTGDIKGGLLMALWAMKALTEFDDNFDVQLIISAEEEIGSPTLREWYTTNAAQADYVICMTSPS